MGYGRKTKQILDTNALPPAPPPPQEKPTESSKSSLMFYAFKKPVFTRFLNEKIDDL